MRDPRALRNTSSLQSWRAWESLALRRSGFALILAGFIPLEIVFVVAVTLAAHSLRGVEALFGADLAAGLGLLALALQRLLAWRRANPWTPPSKDAFGPDRDSALGRNA
jgi:hypothetical protein